jgi:hypothetical protein
LKSQRSFNYANHHNLAVSVTSLAARGAALSGAASRVGARELKSKAPTALWLRAWIFRP